MAEITTNTFSLSEAVTCPECKNEIIIYDPKHSEFCVCGKCGDFLSLKDFSTPKVKRKVDLPKAEPLLKLGSIGTIKDDKFKVIAFLVKRERGTAYYWREYILFNYEKGYATLSEFNGHWSFIVGENFYPELSKSVSFGDSAEYHGANYKLFNKYAPIVDGIQGEFDWNIFEDSITSKEFIAPPYLLVREENNFSKIDVKYYLGEYLEPEEIASSFGIDIIKFPTKIDIGANELSKSFNQRKKAIQLSLAAILIVVIVHLLISIIKPEKILVDRNFNIEYLSDKNDGSFKSFVTPSFTTNANSAIDFNISSGVDNNWLEATIVLVSETDNKTWEVSKGIEYYRGYEDGESWSEGSTSESILISDIPAGKYHLNVYPSSGDLFRKDLYIKATANTSIWRNTIITILLLCIYPIYCWYTLRNFEKRRWANSDYSPFISE